MSDLDLRPPGSDTNWMRQELRKYEEKMEKAAHSPGEVKPASEVKLNTYPPANTYTTALPTPPTSESLPVAHDFTQNIDNGIPLVSRAASPATASDAPLFQPQTIPQFSIPITPQQSRLVPGRFTLDHFRTMSEAICRGETGLPPNVLPIDVTVVYDARIRNVREEVPYSKLQQLSRKYVRMRITDAQDPDVRSQNGYLASQMREPCWTAATLLAYTGYLDGMPDVWTVQSILQYWEQILDNKSVDVEPKSTNTLRRRSNIPLQPLEKKQTKKVTKSVPQTNGRDAKRTAKKPVPPIITPTDEIPDDNLLLDNQPGPSMSRSPSNASTGSNDSSHNGTSRTRKRKASSNEAGRPKTKKVKRQTASDAGEPKAKTRNSNVPANEVNTPSSRFGKVVKALIMDVGTISGIKTPDEVVIENLSREWNKLCPNEPLVLSTEEESFIQSNKLTIGGYQRIKHQLCVGTAILVEHNRRMEKVRKLTGNSTKLWNLNKTQCQYYSDRDVNRTSPVFVKLTEIGIFPTLIVNDKINQYYLDKYSDDARKALYEKWAEYEKKEVDEEKHQYIPLTSSDEAIIIDRKPKPIEEETAESATDEHDTNEQDMTDA